MTAPTESQGRSASRRDHEADLEIVIPVYNEEQVISLLVARLDAVFGPEERSRDGLKEVRYLFVDDGSRDQTVALLRQANLRNKARIISLSRNFGHQAALSAGLANARADMVAIIDGDLQDPPELIPAMIRKWREGYDVIYGRRRKREESWPKVFGYKLFYRLFRLLSPIDVPVDSGDFCLMDRRVLEALACLPEKLRLHRALRAWVGFSQTGLSYDRPARVAGSTKYSWGRLYKLATDGLASLSTLPLRVAQFLALLFFLLPLVLLVLYRAGALGSSTEDLLVAVVFFQLISMGVVLFSIYVLGAYIGRMYLEVKNRPVFIIKEVLELRPGEGNDGP